MISLGIVCGLIVMLLWGIADFLLSVPTRKIGALKTMFIQNLFGATITLVFLFLFLSHPFQLTLRNFLIIFIGGVADVLAMYFFYRSFEIGEVSIVSPVSGSYSLVTVVLSFILLGEILAWYNYVGIVLIIIGIILTSTDIRKLKSFHAVKGIPESIAAMVLWGFYFFLIAGLSKEMDAISLFFFTGLTNSIIVLVFLLLKRNVPLKAEFLNKKILIIMIICTVFYNIAWLFMTYGATIAQMSLLAPISSLYPAVTIILAVIFLKEKLILNQKIGIAMILVSLFLLSI
ncbi:MAG: DMT family transporter [archaeon]